MMKIKKVILVILLCILIIMGIGIIIFVSQYKGKNVEDKVIESDVIYNDSIGIIEDKEIDNILFTGITCEINEEYTNLKYQIINNNDSEVTLNQYQLVFKNENNEVVGFIYSNVSTSITAGSSLSVENTANINLKEAIKMEIELGGVD